MKALAQLVQDEKEPAMSVVRQPIVLRSLAEELAGMLFLPQGLPPCPALVLCHGAGEFKESYFELAEFLAQRGIAALALDLHGHGHSEGERFHVNMAHWVADIRAAVDFLSQRPEIAPDRIGAFGLSSGGTAILEAALVDPRLKVLVALSATVRDSLPWPMSLLLKLLIVIGKVKRRLTGRDLRLKLAEALTKYNVAADPEVNRQLHEDERLREAFSQFPLPGAAEAFFVDTLRRVPRIQAPTLVLWGAEDPLDPPETASLLYQALTCKKQYFLIAGNGHVGHLDRHKAKVFQVTADWVFEHVGGPEPSRQTESKTVARPGTGAAGRARKTKWELLAPLLRQHGREALSYATLQDGMEYYVHPCGYIAYVTARHPLLARTPLRIVLCDPVCAEADYARILEDFLRNHRRTLFAVISGKCAEVLRGLGFKANCIGCEAELPIQTYNTQGNWKELDLIKRGRNEARREGITIREEDIESVNKEQIAAMTARWISTKKVNDREIWIYARRALLEREEDVRKFVAYDRNGQVAGYAFYDPIYREGRVTGYAANIVRCDEQRFGRLATALHMTAIETFRPEGKEVLNLALAPFVKLDRGRFNDDRLLRWFLELSARYGNEIYNFVGLSFHKSKYRGSDKPIYYATRSLMASNDVYLAFRSADISSSYLGTIGLLLRGMVKSWWPSSRSAASALPGAEEISKRGTNAAAEKQ